MAFYGIGNKKKKNQDGEVVFVDVLIPLTEGTRVGAVNQAERIARRDRVQLQGVYPVRKGKDSGGILTKNMKRQKASRN